LVYARKGTKSYLRKIRGNQGRYVKEARQRALKKPVLQALIKEEATKWRAKHAEAHGDNAKAVRRSNQHMRSDTAAKREVEKLKATLAREQLRTSRLNKLLEKATENSEKLENRQRDAAEEAKQQEKNKNK
jgi:hypothetical protein